MKIVLAGANGFPGRALARHFTQRGHEVVGLVRHAEASAFYRPVRWNGAVLDDWAGELEGAAALINLAGQRVTCRSDSRIRAGILHSRTASTRILGDAIALCQRPPAVWINASTANIYRHADDRPQDEHYGEPGDGFAVEVAQAWEKAFFAARVPGTVRKVAIRTALVLGPERGTVLARLLRLARWGLGGRIGSGSQMVSWIHRDDFCRAVGWLVAHRECDGIFNLSAPGPVPNREFMTMVRRVAGMRIGLPAARWMLEIGARLLSADAEPVLKSRWVIPSRLTANGFSFRWPEVAGALADLVSEGTDPLAGGAKKWVPAK